MFEQSKSTIQPQQPSIKKPEDMFAVTDPIAQKHSASPQDMSSQAPESRQPMIVGSSSKRKNLLLFLIIVVIVGIGVGAIAYYFTKRTVKLQEPVVREDQTGITQDQIPNQNPQVQEPAESTNMNNVSSSQEELQNQPTVLPPTVPQYQVPEQPIDQDQDGLTLLEETNAGTSDQLVDTDLDGLSDWDEVRIYKSSPLNADTDGDGYIDGHEVKNGYSPTGSGKLQEIPKQ